MRGQEVSTMYNNHNYDQLLVTPNEVVGLYCCDYLRSERPTAISDWFVS